MYNKDSWELGCDSLFYSDYGSLHYDDKFIIKGDIAAVTAGDASLITYFKEFLVQHEKHETSIIDFNAKFNKFLDKNKIDPEGLRVLIIYRSNLFFMCDGAVQFEISPKTQQFYAIGTADQQAEAVYHAGVRDVFGILKACCKSNIFCGGDLHKINFDGKSFQHETLQSD